MMKLVLLTLFSLILVVCSEDAIEEAQFNADHYEGAPTDFFESLFPDYYNQKQNSNKKSSKPKSSKSQNKNKQSYNKNEKAEYVEVIEYLPVDNYNYKGLENKNYKEDYKNGYEYKKYQEQYKLYEEEYDRLIGREGLGFDKRTASAIGLRTPITPELLQVVGKYNDKKELIIKV